MIWGSLLRLAQVAVLILVLSPLSLCQNTFKKSFETVQNYLAPQQQPFTDLFTGMRNNSPKFLGNVKTDLGNVMQGLDQQSNTVEGNRHHHRINSLNKNMMDNLDNLQKLQRHGSIMTTVNARKQNENLFQYNSDLNQSKIINYNSSNNLINGYNILNNIVNSEENITLEDFNINNALKRNINGLMDNLIENVGYSGDKSNEIKSINRIGAYKVGPSFINYNTVAKQLKKSYSKGLRNRLQFRNITLPSMKMNKNKFVISRQEQSDFNTKSDNDLILLLSTSVQVSKFSQQQTKRSSGFHALINEFINRLPSRSNVSQLQVTQVHSCLLNPNCSSGNLMFAQHLKPTTVGEVPVYMDDIYETTPSNFKVTELKPGLPAECYTTKPPPPSCNPTTCQMTDKKCSEEHAFFRRVHHHPEDEDLIKSVTPTRKTTGLTDVAGSVKDVLDREDFNVSVTVNAETRQSSEIQTSKTTINSFKKTVSKNEDNRRITGVTNIIQLSVTESPISQADIETTMFSLETSTMKMISSRSVGSIPIAESVPSNADVVTECKTIIMKTSDLCVMTECNVAESVLPTLTNTLPAYEQPVTESPSITETTVIVPLISEASSPETTTFDANASGQDGSEPSYMYLPEVSDMGILLSNVSAVGVLLQNLTLGDLQFTVIPVSTVSISDSLADALQETETLQGNLNVPTAETNAIITPNDSYPPENFIKLYQNYTLNITSYNILPGPSNETNGSVTSVTEFNVAENVLPIPSEIIEDYINKSSHMNDSINCLSNNNNNNGKSIMYWVSNSNATTNGSKMYPIDHYEFLRLKHRLRNKNNSFEYYRSNLNESTPLFGLDADNGKSTNKNHVKTIFDKNHTHYHFSHSPHHRVSRGKTKFKVNITTTQTQASQTVKYAKETQMIEKKVNDSKIYKTEFALHNRSSNDTYNINTEKHSNQKNLTGNKKDLKKNLVPKINNISNKKTIENKTVSKLLQNLYKMKFNIPVNSSAFGNRSDDIAAYYRLNGSNSDRFMEYLRSKSVLGEIFRTDNPLVSAKISAIQLNKIHKSEMIRPVKESVPNNRVSNESTLFDYGDHPFATLLPKLKLTSKYLNFNGNKAGTRDILVNNKLDGNKRNSIKPIKFILESESKNNLQNNDTINKEQQKNCDLKDNRKLHGISNNVHSLEKIKSVKENNMNINDYQNDVQDYPVTMENLISTTLNTNLVTGTNITVNNNSVNSDSFALNITKTELTHPPQNTVVTDVIVKINEKNNASMTENKMENNDDSGHLYTTSAVRNLKNAQNIKGNKSQMHRGSG